MNTEELNQTHLEFQKFEHSDFDTLPYPVVIVNSDCKVTFKNKYAYKLKLINLNMNILNLLNPKCHNDFIELCNKGGSGVFECKIEKGISHACVISFPNRESVVFLTICSVILRKMLGTVDIDLPCETFYINKAVVKAYLNMCEKYKSGDDPKAAELLRYNSLRFSRAARNMSMYIHTLTKTENFEEEASYDLRDICSKMIEHFESKVAPLGFRLGIAFKDTFLCTKIQKNTFVCVFLELCSIALRLSTESKCTIKMYKSENEIKVDYHFSTPPKDLAFATYASELQFVKSVADFCKWHFEKSEIFADGETGFSFSVPVIMEVSHIVKSSIMLDGFIKEEMYSICEDIVSALFFF